MPLELWARFVAHGRRARHLSQAELGRRAGVSQQTVSKIEAGLLCPHDGLKARLAAALEVTPGDLFPWPPRPPLMAAAIVWPDLRGRAGAAAPDA
ncbi:MAG TPA: helix-turn-helix transcriptional regulator [Iamia sp.]|nr:helix-turn-helix transcriptional regulator [Iamia sp.]